MRVYELAKELGLATKEMMDILALLKIAVKSHSSSLTVAQEERVRLHVAATRPKGKKAAPLPAAPPPPAPEPKIDARTPTGERILGVRKITAPAAPPEAARAPELRPA
ncbi:MAG: translation initiation factor IF-2 N-terminal domain-containing protein, partial [Firmicutes bacterium]|nr:translation initiation factor IF-2 N-terminal domain-containing protein [Bacillota bacterium]